jgi:hypothetical protein
MQIRLNEFPQFNVTLFFNLRELSRRTSSKHLSKNTFFVEIKNEEFSWLLKINIDMTVDEKEGSNLFRREAVSGITYVNLKGGSESLRRFSDHLPHLSASISEEFP